MKYALAIAITLAATPSYACTPAQTAMYNLAIRLMNTAVDISKTAGGPKADKAVNTIMDLVADIDASLPRTCGK